METKSKVSTEVLHKEIDLIQSCITRMADCSFKLKGWYISLVTIAITLLLGQGCKMFVIGGFLFIVTTLFWILDGFFLKMETLYRWKYNWVIKKRLEGDNKYLYDLNPYEKNMWDELKNKNECIMKFILSKTLFIMYGVAWIISLILLVFGVEKIIFK